MDVISDDAGQTYKRAGTANERRQIEHEAAVLRQVAHPGIVQLLGTEGADRAGALVLRTVKGGNLTGLGEQPMPVVAGLGAALATTVADLHAIGFSHGGIEASHVLLDEAGRPVLCSLGGSALTATAADPQRLRDDDLRALATMLLQLLPPNGSLRLARTLREVANPSRRRPRRDARWLARHLTSAVPDARLPGPDPGDGSASDGAARMADGASLVDDGAALVDGAAALMDGGAALMDACAALMDGGAALMDGASSHRRRARAVPPSRTVGIVTGCIVVAGAAVLAGWVVASSGSPGRAAGEAATPCPVVDDGCAPIAVHGGVLAQPAGRYEVGGPGDVVVLGRWGCGLTAFPAVLRPRTGDVWDFDVWPAPRESIVGRLVAHVASASSLQVLPGRSGCDQLEVERRDLPPVTLLGIAR